MVFQENVLLGMAPNVLSQPLMQFRVTKLGQFSFNVSLLAARLSPRSILPGFESRQPLILYQLLHGLFVLFLVSGQSSPLGSDSGI